MQEHQWKFNLLHQSSMFKYLLPAKILNACSVFCSVFNIMQCLQAFCLQMYWVCSDLRK
jgi:hypothetical protein